MDVSPNSHVLCTGFQLPYWNNQLFVVVWGSRVTLCSFALFDFRQAAFEIFQPWLIWITPDAVLRQRNGRSMTSFRRSCYAALWRTSCGLKTRAANDSGDLAFVMFEEMAHTHSPHMAWLLHGYEMLMNPPYHAGLFCIF